MAIGTNFYSALKVALACVVVSGALYGITESIKSESGRRRIRAKEL